MALFSLLIDGRRTGVVVSLPEDEGHASLHCPWPLLARMVLLILIPGMATGSSQN